MVSQNFIKYKYWKISFITNKNHDKPVDYLRKQNVIIPCKENKSEILRVR